MSDSSAPVVVRKRSRNRRAEIIEIASHLFYERGLTGATLSELATEVGITDAAFFRHFSSVAEIRAAVVEQALQDLLSKIDETTPPQSAEGWLELLVDVTLAEPRMSMFWHRDAQRLDQSDRPRLREALSDFSRFIAKNVFRECGTLDRHHHLRSWWCLSAGGVVSLTKSSLPTETFRQLLVNCFIVAVRTPRLTDAPTERPRIVTCSPNLREGRTSQYEAVLDTALEAFSSAGYQATRMEHISSRAGVPLARLYSEFSSKEQLLYAVFDRGYTRLQLNLHDILGMHHEPEAALRDLVRSYCSTVLSYPEHFNILFRELHLLGSEFSSVARKQQDQYTSEWVRLLSLLRPNLEKEEARIVVFAAMLGIADLARTAHMTEHHDFEAEAEVEAISMNVLLNASADPAERRP